MVSPARFNGFPEIAITRLARARMRSRVSGRFKHRVAPRAGDPCAGVVMTVDRPDRRAAAFARLAQTPQT